MKNNFPESHKVILILAIKVNKQLSVNNYHDKMN